MLINTFLSTNPASDCPDIVNTVRGILQEQTYTQSVPFVIHEISGEHMATKPADIDKNLAEAQQLIRASDLFIGVYCAAYTETNEALIKMLMETYRLASQHGLMTLIFLQETEDKARIPQASPFGAFIDYLAQHQVIHDFEDEDELADLLRLNLDKYIKTRRSQMTQAAPARKRAEETVEALKTALPETTETTDEFDDLIERAINLAQDDIERIMQRALDLHDARHRLDTTDQSSGWKYVNPIFGEPLKGSQFESDIFMVMPFRKPYDDVYRNIIVPTAQSLNLSIKRGDDFSSISGVIISEVWAALNACKMVIADVTEVNPNVYYELGIAHTLGKPTVLITQEGDIEKWAFDIRHMRFIVYDNTIAGGESLEAELRRSIVWVMNDLQDNNSAANNVDGGTSDSEQS